MPWLMEGKGVRVFGVGCIRLNSSLNLKLSTTAKEIIITSINLLTTVEEHVVNQYLLLSKLFFKHFNIDHVRKLSNFEIIGTHHVYQKEHLYQGWMTDPTGFSGLSLNLTINSTCLSASAPEFELSSHF